MLIISRKSGESFEINENIEIVILEVQGDKVRIGVNAPKDIKVVRSELKEAAKQNEEAAGSVEEKKLRRIADLLKEQGK